MSQFEFLTVIISIVLAFGISDILSNWGKQILLRREISFYGLHLAWTILLILVMIQAWWGLWLLRDRPEWTFPAYVLLITPYLTLALIAYVLTPEFSQGERDIRHYYFDNSRWLFSLVALYLAAWSVFSLTVIGEALSDVTNLMRTAAIVLMIGLAVWRSERLHQAAVVIAYLLWMVYVALKVFAL